MRTLLLRPARESADVQPLAGLPEAVVTDAFLTWSADQQYSLLSTFWNRLMVAAMVGPLEKIVEQPEIPNQILRDVALQRLFELDPSAATPRILEEIKHPHFDNGMFTVKGETLGLLPEETLPQFDQLLASRIEGEDRRTWALDAQLIGRYATKAILPRVRAVYEAASGQWDCVSADGQIRITVFGDWPRNPAPV